MSIQAQLMMVMALDKCIGCHACSVSCRRSWTDRPGSEHAWFNNVETKPGLGYPQGWDDRGNEDDRRHLDDRGHSGSGSQDGAGRGPVAERPPSSSGGWELDEKGHLQLRGGSGSGKRATLLGGRSPSGPVDYYEPWTYEFQVLTEAPLTDGPPVAGTRSLATGMPMEPSRGPNWDDDLAGTKWPGGAELDPRESRLSPSQEELHLRFERIFMLYLPRICNHCLNPPCAAACPSKAIYKRSSDGIVLVDEEKCRGRNSCVAACPYKKVYVNRLTEKAEKCMFCLPGVTENGLPALCAENCVGRIRSIGVVLYDSEAVARVAETDPEADLVEAQRRLLLDPNDVSVSIRAEEDGVPHQWLEAARRSPVYALVKELRVALPLRPEFRTLPMVWYVPPLSPVIDSLGLPDSPPHVADESSGPGRRDGEAWAFGGAEKMRIPLEYLADLFAAGDPAPVKEALSTLVAMRTFKRHQQVHGEDAAHAMVETGIDPARLDRLFRLLALGERKERFVVPTARYETAQPRPSSSKLQPPEADRAGEET